MARTPRKAAAAKSGGKARKGPAKTSQTRKKSAPSKQPSGVKKVASRKAAPRRNAESAGAQPGRNWTGAIQALVTSSVGRGILADVLEAAAGALRKGRQGVDEAVDAGATAASSATDTAAGAGTDIAASAAALVQTATDAMADIAETTARALHAPTASGRGLGGRSARTRGAE